MKRYSKVQELHRHNRKRRPRRNARSKDRGMHVENLEARMLLATGPKLVGINPNSALIGISPGEDAVLRDNDVLNAAPRELVFRFNMLYS